jgi:hypothetical protein
MPNGKHIEVVYRDHRRPARPDTTTTPEPAYSPAPVYGSELGDAPFHPAPSADPGCPPQELHVCFSCAGELVYPLDWTEEGARHWRIVLRCPECEAYREGVFEQSVVERLDDELDRGAGALLSDLKRLTHANMTDEVEFFVRALEADLITPGDF